MKCGPVGGQFARGQEPQRVPPPVRIRLQNKVHELRDCVGRLWVISELYLAVLRLQQEED